MDLIIDPEFRDLIPPLTEGEHQGLESSIVENGYNPAFPVIVWKGQGIIVDGHNRYGICQKHGLPFEYVEQEFASRYDVVSWILENQIFRRNVNQITRLYLIGRRYLVEKNEWGNFERVNSPSPQNEDLGKTSHKIAAQLKVGHATVERAFSLTSAIDTIVLNTGINRMSILSGDIKGTQDEIKELASKDTDSQKRIVDLILNEGELSISLATSRLWDENREKHIKEAEQKKQQMEEQLKAEREAEAAKEREHLKIAHEERLKVENERIEKEKAEQEKRKLAEIEQQKALAEQKAKDDAERERIRKENEELERIAMEKMEEDFKHLQDLKKKKLEEQKHFEEERIKQAQIEKEKQDKEKVKEAIKVEIPSTPFDPYVECAYKIMGEISLNACKKKGTRYIINTAEEHSDEVTLNKNWKGKVWLEILGAKSDSKLYVEKLVKGYVEGSITEAFAIAKNDTGTAWFKLISQKSKAIVFPTNGELKNYALIYFGNNYEAFIQECSKFGWGIILKNDL